MGYAVDLEVTVIGKTVEIITKKKYKYLGYFLTGTNLMQRIMTIL